MMVRTLMLIDRLSQASDLVMKGSAGELLIVMTTGHRHIIRRISFVLISIFDVDIQGIVIIISAHGRKILSSFKTMVSVSGHHDCWCDLSV